jgi:uncharacterized protein
LFPNYFMTDGKLTSLALVAAVLIGGGFYLQGKKMEVRPLNPASISVSGEGKVTASPDIAELTFGVSTGRRATAKDAMAMLERDMNAIFDAATEAGIAKEDIKTEQLSMNPSYDWTTNGQVLRGFEASQSLRVKVRDLDKVGDVLSAATAAGANQVGGVTFTIDDPNALQEEARTEAIADAKKKAEALADSLGLNIKRITSYTENTGGWSPPIMYRAEEMAMDGAANQKAVPVPGGTQDVVINATITYELE